MFQDRKRFLQNISANFISTIIEYRLYFNGNLECIRRQTSYCIMSLIFNKQQMYKISSFDFVYIRVIIYQINSPNQTIPPKCRHFAVKVAVKFILIFGDSRDSPIKIYMYIEAYRLYFNSDLDCIDLISNMLFLKIYLSF